MKAYIFFLIMAATLWCGCKKTDGFNTVVSTDKTKPGVVTNIKVANFNGGAYITYSLPDSKDILYVQAQYKINDKDSRQTKSSYYSDSVTVGGFAKSQDYQVTLWTVTRAEVRSDSVVVTVHPDTPAYLKVLPTVTMTNDFSGVHVMALNPLQAPVGVITITADADGKQQIVSQNYSTGDTIQFSLRGYDTLNRKFGVYITDKWGNISDTVFSNIKPLYETQMDKSLFQPYVLGTDAPTGFGWVIQNMWDNNTGSPGYHTTQPIQPLVWPAVITFDMGEVAKLSRYTIWNRGIDGSGNFLWQAGAPLTWVLWGRSSTPQDETMPDADHLPPVGGTSSNGWINLGYFRLPDKPSKLPNPQYTSEDLAFWNAGFSYDFDISLPKVRYIRFECLENVSLTNTFFNIEELTFWGDTR
ncbi:MAG TPA: DUF4959 domain-containing protein [Puia sp.]|nr:DUF4959 domain-containing protein [Puia sp.]